MRTWWMVGGTQPSLTKRTCLLVASDPAEQKNTTRTSSIQSAFSAWGADHRSMMVTERWPNAEWGPRHRSRILVRGPVEFWPQGGGAWAQKLLKMGAFPLKLPETAWFWRNLLGQGGGHGPQGPPWICYWVHWLYCCPRWAPPLGEQRIDTAEGFDTLLACCERWTRKQVHGLEMCPWLALLSAKQGPEAVLSKFWAIKITKIASQHCLALSNFCSKLV